MNKLPPLASIPFKYGLSMLALTAGLAIVTCWRQLSGAGDVVDKKVTQLVNEPTFIAQHNDASDLGNSSLPPELELLNEIRGHIGSPLDSSLFQGGGTGSQGRERIFDQSYRRQASQQIEASSEIGAIAAAPFDPRQQFCVSLRNAARQLDQGAADLEDDEAFELADELREQAQQLRQRARSSSAPSSTDENANP